MGFLQGLLGGGKAKSNPVAATGLTFQTSSYGAPIPLCYGTTRMPGNIIWYGNFQSYSQAASGGGKGGALGGGGGGKGGSTNYTYTTGVAFGICEGPINGIGNVYADKNIDNLGTFGLSIFYGTYSQQPWSFLSQNYTSAVTVSQTIPASSPYTITISPGFLSDAGVNYGATSVQMTSVSTSPGPNQFQPISVSGFEYLSFNSANAGQQIVISGTDVYGLPVSNVNTIPNTSPYYVPFPPISGNLNVTATLSAFIPVAGSPASGQYSVSGSTYTFNSAQAGTTVYITYISSLGDNQALSYHGIAYVASSALQLGNSPQLPNISYEVAGVFANNGVMQELIGEQDVIPGSPYQISVQYAADFVSDSGVTDTEGNPFTYTAGSPGGTYQYTVSGGVYTFYSGDQGVTVNINYTASVGPDADPSLVVADLLTNAHYGAGFPSNRVGSLSTYQAYCISTGLLISPSYSQQASAASMLDDIATNTNSAWVWSSGQLTLVPYGDQTITANGYTYTAPNAPLYSLTDDDFEKQTSPLNSSAAANDDPVILTRKRPADQINSVKVECLDRNNQYNTAIIEAKDQALIENFGLRQSTTTQTHLFCNLGAGRLSAQLQLQRQGIMNMYSFTLDQRYIVLDPMDIVAITDTPLGLNQQWVRIVEIQENDDSTLSFFAEEYLGNGHAPAYSFQQSRGYTANYNASPGGVNIPVIFVPPIEIAATGLEVWMAVSGANPDLWGGCDVWISQDNNTYTKAGRINGESRQGTLTANLANTADPDTTDTLSVSLAESQSILSSGTQADADSFVTLCYVDSELISYETATLTGLYQYGLTYLRRGCYGTTVAQHLTGSQFARLDNGIFTYSINKGFVGNTIYIKLLSFNLWGSGQQTLADVNPITFVVPYPPAPAQVQNFNAQQQGAVVVFDWDDLQPYDVGLKGYDIAYGAPGTPWSTKELLTEAARGTEMTNAAVPPGTWEFSIRGHDITDQLGAISTVELIVTNENDIISEAVQEPSWLGTLTNFVLHYTGVLIPQDQHYASYYTTISAPATPTTGSTSGGALTATTYYVKITYVDATGESVASAEATQAVAASYLLTVNSPITSGLATGWNVYVATSSGSETLQNSSPIGIGVTWTEPVSGLVSGVSPPSYNQTGFQVFDQFVPTPVSSASYIAPTVDTGYNDTLRVYATNASTLGAGQSGAAANLQLAIDTWLTGGSDPDDYIDWTTGFVTLRYMNAELQYNDITAGNVSYITDFTPIIDTAPTIENAGSVTISAGGTAITFPTPYHTAPYVQVSVVGSSALYATAASVSATGFTAHVWNTSGTDVGGVIAWTATGS